MAWTQVILGVLGIIWVAEAKASQQNRLYPDGINQISQVLPTTDEPNLPELLPEVVVPQVPIFLRERPEETPNLEAGNHCRLYKYGDIEALMVEGFIIPIVKPVGNLTDIPLPPEDPLSPMPPADQGNQDILQHSRIKRDVVLRSHPLMCGNFEIKQDSTVTIHTPYYPAKYTSNFKCRWIITVLDADAMVINCPDFQLAKGDSLTTTIVGKPTTLKKYTLTNGPVHQIVEGNAVRLLFTSNRFRNQRGFLCTVAALAPTTTTTTTSTTTTPTTTTAMTTPTTTTTTTSTTTTKPTTTTTTSPTTTTTTTPTTTTTTSPTTTTTTTPTTTTTTSTTTTTTTPTTTTTTSPTTTTTSTTTTKPTTTTTTSPTTTTTTTPTTTTTTSPTTTTTSTTTTKPTTTTTTSPTTTTTTTPTTTTTTSPTTTTTSTTTTKPTTTTTTSPTTTTTTTPTTTTTTSPTTTTTSTTTTKPTTTTTTTPTTTTTTTPTTTTTTTPTTTTTTTTKPTTTTTTTPTTTTTTSPTTTTTTSPTTTTTTSPTTTTTTTTVSTTTLPPLSHPDCGITNRDRIVNGQSATANEYPWQSFLEVKWSDGKNQLCGGSLITKQWILTAGHCVLRKDGSGNLWKPEVKVTLGMHTRTTPLANGGFQVTATAVEIHPQNNFAYDLALIKLPQEVEYKREVRPVCLPNRNLLGRNVTSVLMALIGWGKTETGKLTDELRELSRYGIESAICKTVFGSYITDHHFCTSGIDEKHICLGDSGGPVMTVDRGRFTLTGVVSFVATQDCKGQYPDGHISVVHFLDWIQEITKQALY
ncbi:mucin-5AC-like isoform X2 [Macrobrachium nipponense]|uniref:mucin-5AC-like isoform X2 n=1 Tax=Macrobrachium nipponense TaxID=159736 RepID=UPI0030C822D4